MRSWSLLDSACILSELLEKIMRVTFGPLILVAVGVLLLLSNLDILPLVKVKAFAATWWPVVLIVAGVLQLRKRG